MSHSVHHVQEAVGQLARVGDVLDTFGFVFLGLDLGEALQLGTELFLDYQAGSAGLSGLSSITDGV